MFLEKLNLTIDLNQVILDMHEIVNLAGWGDINQISLVHRPNIVDKNEQWRDGIGSLFNGKEKIAQESDFTVVNELVPEYTKKILNDLAQSQNISIGRARLMNLPIHCGLGVHEDESVRYHLAIVTHKHAYMGVVSKNEMIPVMCYHIPADGCFYKADTRMQHFVFNGNRYQRVHLVICPR